MRTTLDIDTELLQAAKEMARRQHKTAGQVVSDLLRKALTGDVTDNSEQSENLLGFEPFPARSGVVLTNEMINEMRDELGD